MTLLVTAATIGQFCYWMDTMMKIEKGVSLPPNMRMIKYPFQDMGVGDSILFTEKQKAESARVSSLRFVTRRAPAWRFSMRKVAQGWRLWRIA